MRAFVQAQFGGYNTLKKGVSIEQFWPLPGDEITPKQLATVRFMSREEIKERYARAGIHFKEVELDQMMVKIEKAKEREAEKRKQA